MAERVLQMKVTADLADDFDKHKHLLSGREVARELSPDGRWLVITMVVPDAPEGAVQMSPWFTLTGRDIALGGIDYYDANERRIG